MPFAGLRKSCGRLTNVIHAEEKSMTNAHVKTTNWEKLNAALQQETVNMERAAGEKIVDVNLLSDNEVSRFAIASIIER